MAHLQRLLKIELPPRQSAFLWGPRKTGKSTLLRSLFPQSTYIDFLKTDLVQEYTKQPHLLRERLQALPEATLNQPVILDEVQKVPALLNEVHWLIENRGVHFILCGSSARKLRRGQANLLGGRAWRFELFPLVSPEIGDLDLLRALNNGLIPDHYLQSRPDRSLRAYALDYLKEEVFAEGLVRNVPAFSRFFDAVGFSHGEQVNFSNIARDCGVDSKTVREYYQILDDTLVGELLPPYKRRQSRDVISKTPKFYLFDVGLAGVLSGRRITQARGEQFGKALEHLILMEIRAHRSMKELHYPIHYWRTRSGLEVDFILGDGEVAIEVKGAGQVDARDMRALKSFASDYRPRKAIVVCNEQSERIHDGIEVLPWRSFLTKLWNGDVLG
jgi:predicted AAA+ superfamily ATPase